MNIPDHLMSECAIQAQFYLNCNQIKLNCALELSTPAGRIDCGLFSDDWINLIAIVECKHNTDQKVSLTSQIKRYKQLGVPVYGLARMNSMSLAETIKSANYTGIAWDMVQSHQKIARYHRRRKFNPQFDVDEMINFRK